MKATSSADQHLSGPRVSIVILNWNGLRDTLECLRSVDDLTYIGFEVIVVDNGSHDGSQEALRSQYPGLMVIENGRNLGYAGGNNIGIRHAFERGADYIWLLNNDTVVDNECLSRLVMVAESDEKLGLLSPAVYDFPLRSRLKWAGTKFDRSEVRFVSLTEISRHPDSNVEGPLVLWGTALLVRRSVVEEVGYLDERYFAYLEDYDYSLRAIERGVATRVVGDARVYHKSARSLGENSPVRYYLRARNLYLVSRLHSARPWGPVVAMKYVARVLADALDASEVCGSEQAAACLDGMWNAFRGRFGDWSKRQSIPRPLRIILMWRPYLWMWVLEGRIWAILPELVARTRRMLFGSSDGRDRG